MDTNIITLLRELERRLSVLERTGGINYDTGGNTAVWGAITGSIGDQSDLTSALAAKISDTGDQTIDGTLTLSEALQIQELSIDPPNPAEGKFVLWMSNGTGSGDDGDIMMKVTAGGTTKTITLVDFSAA